LPGIGYIRSLTIVYAEPPCVTPTATATATSTPTATATLPICPPRTSFDTFSPDAELLNLNATPEACVPDVDCADGTISMISSIAFEVYRANNLPQVQELADMRILSIMPGLPVGLYPLQNPVLNSPRYGTALEYFQGSTILKVFGRIQFPQIVNGTADTQIWYQVHFPDRQSPAGWIPVRYDGLNYVEGFNPVGNIDPCAGVSGVGVPTTLTFNYDRRAAANYAIEHSYDTAFNHGVLQSQGQVTQRLASNPTLPYAYFRYSGIGQQQFVTGSAAFVSESLWMGGMPMTVGQADSCTVDPAGQTALGWRYCFNNPQAVPPLGVASNPYDTHEDFFAYWTSNSFNNVLQNNATLGILANTITGRTTEDSELSQFYQINTRLSQGIISDAAGLSQLVNQRIGNQIKQGDYLYLRMTDSNPPPNHGLVIIGWYSAINCSEAVFTRRMSRVLCKQSCSIESSSWKTSLKPDG
jgi:hypothetical protein